MKSLNLINTKSVEFSIVAIILAIILLVIAQSLFAQTKIGGIKIDGIKLPDTKGTTKPKPKPDATTDNTQTTSTNSQNTKDDPPDWFLNVMLSDIEKAKGEVDLYTNPEERLYLVSTPSSPWLLRAVSAKARDEYAIDKKFNDWRKANAGNKFDTALDGLAASAAKKLPAYIPGADDEGKAEKCRDAQNFPKSVYSTPIGK